MLVNKAFRYELKPNNKQIGLLIKHCGVARFTWNWALSRRIELYKTQWYGSKLVVISRFEPSSKRCNHCGGINHDLKLSDRTWVCLNCGVVNERDTNAACNIRDKGIELLDTDSLSELQACGVDVRPSQRMAVDNEAGIKHICYK